MSNEVLDTLIIYLNLCLKENHEFYSIAEMRAFKQAIQYLEDLKITKDVKEFFMNAEK